MKTKHILVDETDNKVQGAFDTLFEALDVVKERIGSDDVSVGLGTNKMPVIVNGVQSEYHIVITKAYDQS